MFKKGDRVIAISIPFLRGGRGYAIGDKGEITEDQTASAFITMIWDNGRTDCVLIKRLALDCSSQRLFKKGDNIVKINSHSSHNHQDGDLGVVSKNQPTHSSYVDIRWDDSSHDVVLVKNSNLKLAADCVVDYRGQQFHINGDWHYFEDHPTGRGEEETLTKCKFAQCVGSRSNGGKRASFIFELYESYNGMLVSARFSISCQALEGYIQDGVFSLIGDSKSRSDIPCRVKNNDGRDTCYSCGAPTRDYGVMGGFAMGQICTKCNK
jgi:hypothetical protein